MTFRDMVAEDHENKEIQFLQYDNLLQVMMAIAGHMTTLNKSEIESFFLLENIHSLPCRCKIVDVRVEKHKLFSAIKYFLFLNCKLCCRFFCNKCIAAACRKVQAQIQIKPTG